MANDKDFVVAGAVEVGKDTKVTVGSIGSSTVTNISGYNLGVASYQSKSLDLSGQMTGANGLYFKEDGLSLYVGSSSGDSIYQYSLSTAWDVSTASYANKSVSVASQSTNPVEVLFSTTGTKMYVVDYLERVYQYTLSTGWDVSTATYDSVQLNTSSDPSGSLRGGDLKPDGTILYLVSESSPDSVYEYTMSTAFDLSTASYSSNSFNISAQSTTPTGVKFTIDGTKFYVCDEGSDTVFQYSVSTPYDVTTASYDSISFSLASQESALKAIVFGNSGLYLYGVGSSSNEVHQYLSGTTTTTPVSPIDLATGNYFADTPSGASTYTISNAGAVQSFQLEVTGGTAEVAQNFSTTTYAGTSASLTINNGIDLAGEDGLTWIKCRNASEDHFLFSSLQNGSGQTLFLRSNTTGAAVATNGVSQTATGFTVPVDGMVNQTGNDYVSWTFKKEPSFFDVVTYTGTSSARTVAHSLGSVPGCIIVKAVSGAALGGVSDWTVYHRGVDATNPEQYRLYLNTTAARVDQTNPWNDTAPTSTEFTVGTDSYLNANGDTYVAYLFAHDDAADGLIQCGSYTGNGSSNGPEINLGWQPQWVMIKAATRPGGENWVIYDTQRGIVTGSGDPVLFPSDSAAEDFGGSADNSIDLLSTGFKIVGTSGRVNDSYDYIYIAIRAASDLDITWPSSIEWTGGSAPSSPATGETDVFTLSTDDGGTTYTGIKSIDNAS